MLIDPMLERQSGRLVLDYPCEYEYKCYASKLSLGLRDRSKSHALMTSIYVEGEEEACGG